MGIICLFFFVFFCFKMNYFVVCVVGSSMHPSLANGSHLLIKNNHALRIRKTLNCFIHEKNFIKGDIVVIGKPIARNNMIIKRIVGLPGDVIKIEEGAVYINEEKFVEKNTHIYGAREELNIHIIYTLQKDKYFVLGDNYNCSSDSRVFGPVSVESIKGKMVCSLERV